VGCGICISLCNENALVLVRRPENEIQPIPINEAEWRQQRAIARNLNLESIL
jgi:ferredoxin